MTRSLILPVLLGAFLTAHAQEPQAPIHLSGETYGLFDNDLLSSEFHKERREALRNKMPNGGVAVLFANPVRNRSNDVDHEYHQDPDLYYLSGLDEPNGLLIVFKEPHRIAGEQVRELLVVQERDPAREVWNGHRLGTQGAQERLGVEAAVSGAAFLGMDAFLGSEDILFTDIPVVGQAPDPNDPADLSDLIDGFTRMSSDVRQGASNDLMKWMAELREVKGPEELVLMRKAIDITCLAQNELMAKLRPEMTEYQTEAIVEYVFKVNGAEHEGFPSIQGGGPHSCVLHYVTNRRTLGENDLLVSDIGAEYHGYTADVTRTLPANGTFSPEQRAIYDLVYRAQEAGIAKVRAGNAFHAAHGAATEVITKGLMDLGLIQEEREVRRYFMHGTSHYLGLDVHDAGTYGPLKVGNVITVEPGIYIAKGSPCDPKWWNIGVRIEDDILVTEGDPVNLSAGSPRTAEAVEAAMQAK